MMVERIASETMEMALMIKQRLLPSAYPYQHSCVSQPEATAVALMVISNTAQLCVTPKGSFLLTVIPTVWLFVLFQALLIRKQKLGKDW